MRFSGSTSREKFAFVFQCGPRAIGGERLGRFGLICAPSASRGRDGERACHFLLDALHCAGAYANFADHLENALFHAAIRIAELPELLQKPYAATLFKRRDQLPRP